MAIAEPPISPRGLPDTPPPLENGDRLTREEFERRFEAMPDLKKAELIEGVVYMPSPVHQRQHSQPHVDLGAWLGAYRARTPGVGAGDNGSVRMDMENMPQPDLFLFLDPACGGQATISEDDYVEGAPELVAEIASSSASYDLHDKMRAYWRNGVLLYVVWRVRDRAIDWFVLSAGQFERQAPDADGIHRSTIFPGLWLDVEAMLRGDLERVHDVLAQGLATPEHAEFAAKNRAATSEGPG